MNKCKKFQVYILKNMAELSHFECQNMSLFTALQVIFDFLCLFFFILGRVRSVLGSCFVFFTKIWFQNIYHTTQAQNLYFDLPWPRDLGWRCFDTRTLQTEEGTYEYPGQDSYRNISFVSTWHAYCHRESQLMADSKKS